MATHGWRPPRWRRRVVAGLVVVAVLAVAASVYMLPRRASERPRQAGVGIAGLKFDSDRAWADLERQVSFGPRVPGTDAHEDAMRYIAEELASDEWKIKRDRFAEPSGRGDTLKMTNVEAKHPRQLGNVKPVLLVAHYDSRPTADKEKRPEDRKRPIPGANDGASGVAVLLEVARQIAARPDDYVHVQLVFVDGEDWPQRWIAGEPQGAALHGSKHLAAKISAVEGPPRYRYGLVVDMVGDSRLLVLPEQRSVEASQGLVSRVWRTGQAVAPRSFGFQPGPALNDDHVPLIEAGLPTCLIIDFDYRYWHTLEDTPDKCSPDSLEDIGRTVLSVLRRT